MPPRSFRRARFTVFASLLLALAPAATPAGSQPRPIAADPDVPYALEFPAAARRVAGPDTNEGTPRLLVGPGAAGVSITF